MSLAWQLGAGPTPNCDSARAANCQLQVQGGAELELPMRKIRNKTQARPATRSKRSSPGGLWMCGCRRFTKTAAGFIALRGTEGAVGDAEAFPREARDGVLQASWQLQ